MIQTHGAKISGPKSCMCGRQTLLAHLCGLWPKSSQNAANWSYFSAKMAQVCDPKTQFNLAAMYCLQQSQVTFGPFVLQHS